MSYQPKSDDELQKEGLFPEGEYDFDVSTVNDAPSKSSGAPMITLGLRCIAPDGSVQYVTDYLTWGSAFPAKKHKDAAYSCGLQKQYDAGTLTYADFEGRSGKAFLTIEENDSYGSKNKVKYYIRPDGAKEAAPIKKSVAQPVDLNDSVPF